MVPGDVTGLKRVPDCGRGGFDASGRVMACDVTPLAFEVVGLIDSGSKSDCERLAVEQFLYSTHFWQIRIDMQWLSHC